MNHFWRTVSIALGALLATGCFGTPKYGVDSVPPDDTGDTGTDVQPVAADADGLPAQRVPPRARPVEPVTE
jgi:hypothetical protein